MIRRVWTMGRSAVVLTLVCVAVSMAAPLTFEFHAPATATDAAVAGVMRDLAERVLPVYQEPDPDRYLANLSVLQMAEGNYAAADVSRQSLRDRRRRLDAGRPVGRGATIDVYAYAKALEVENKLPFADAFSRAFREVVARLSDRDAYAVTRWFRITPSTARDELQKALDQQRTMDSVTQAQAVELLEKYLAFDAYRSFGPLIDSLTGEDDRRRYTAAEEVQIKASERALITVLVIRPKGPAKPLPSLLEFTIYDAKNYAMECAAHGYAGVVAFTRGVRSKSGPVVPFQHDGEDARAVIEWIARQPWSDGRVGMYGDGYSGFTAWAAAQRPPAPLKAIATSGATAPGIDAPMGGAIFQNSAFRWSLYVTRPAGSDEREYYDDASWRDLDQKWYRSGRRYRDLGLLYGKPNPIFQRWLNHPSYDRYWQSTVPYGEQFAHIDLPVLTMTGYYAGSESGAMYYFNQHTKYRPRADHTLLIGPYDDSVLQRGALPVLQSYAVDPVALVDLHELRYQWFDHVLKGAATPALLKDRVNFEVMGANEWRHVPSIDAMAGDSMRFYLDPSKSGDGRRLAAKKGSKNAFVRQTVNLADRSDAGWMPSLDLISKSLAIHNDTMFVSEPLSGPSELNGAFSATLDFSINKMDVDLNFILFERLANGDYIRLFSPTDEIRASYARDRVHRHLLRAGERQQLSFKAERISSRLLQQGSRLVLVLGVNRRPDREINYGTGDDVSEETVADGQEPLKIRWYADSYIDIPVRRQ